MRILFVSHSFPPPGRSLENLGGMQRVATELHAALASQPDLMLYSRILRTTWAMTHLRTGPFLLGSLFRIPRLVRKHRIEVVLFSSMVTASLAVRLRRRLPGVVLVTITHGQDVTMPVGLYQQFVPKVFAALDAVFPVSRATGAACVERGCDPVRVHVVPNGVDPDRFSPVPEGKRHERLRAAFPEGAGHLTDKALILCSVGRQVQRKGFHWFIDHVMPDVPDDVQYWLAGEGPMGEVIQETIHRHGLEQRVQLLGRVTEEQLEALYQGADLFIMPNIMVPGDMEGFGVVMLEAGLCGLPALGARLEGIQDVITDTENGHLVASGNAGAFAELIIHYHRDRAALADLGRKARRYTLDTFTWPAVARRYVELFRQSL